MIDPIKLIAFNTWANRRLTDQVSTFSSELFTKELGGSFPSIQLTLGHVLTSDYLWLQRFRGIPIADIPATWNTNTVESIMGIWAPIQDEMEASVRELSINQVQKVNFITRAGTAYSLPFADLVVHITNHGTYHRGQIVNMIRMLGEKPVNTDYFIFCTVNSDATNK
ncbi:DinB family protein [Segetibacter aerophilus]|uniref:Damage-inducible protein DinB n=1 Tax=Segetibacter aerophilus TaxID=670293 RepID=A0A512BJL9_9BACT|nr:DinB family protein [Segetibacter aerophilus]GEO12162.1 hypothetical protein SAE01_46580 [Segetibacter aerophilus]